MRRREILIGLVGAALCGGAASAAEKPKRIAVLTGMSEDNPAAPAIEKLSQALVERGWREGDSLRTIYRFAAGDPERVQKFAAELRQLRPDVVVAHTALVVATLHHAIPQLPIVFVSIPDPVADGFVTNLARPGGNMTGFTNYDFAIGTKWLEILTEIAPRTKRVAVLLNPEATARYSSYSGYWHSVETGAKAISVTAALAPVRSRGEIETAIAALAAEPGGGLIVPLSVPITAHIGQVIELTARYRVPAIYGLASYARRGGLVAYGTSLGDLFRRAADYVDRILRGEKAAELPVQQPTKFETVINLKTAKALGLMVPPLLLAQADEVIE